MAISRRSWFACSLLTLVSGCAGTGGGGGQGGSLFAPSASMNSLKTSLSHMEYENRQLKSSVARLESENREIEGELVQEKAANGDLSARLDDARHLISQRGSEVSNDSNKMIPAGRSNRKPKKPPFAQIPGGLETIPEDNLGDSSSTERPARADIAARLRTEGPSAWFPVANVSGEPAPPRR